MSQPPDSEPGSHAHPAPPAVNLSAAVAAALAAVEALDAPAVAEPPRTIDPSTIRGVPGRGRAESGIQSGGPTPMPAVAVSELVQAQNDLAVTRRRYQKLADEHDELRRRLQRAEFELPLAATRQVLQAILPALDNQDAVLAHLETAEALSAHGLSGLAMVRAEWTRALGGLQVQPFDSHGQRFDPVVHEAIAYQADASQTPGQVLRQVRRGYLLSGKLLRSAQVVVVAPADPANP